MVLTLFDDYVLFRKCIVLQLRRGLQKNTLLQCGVWKSTSIARTTIVSGLNDKLLRTIQNTGSTIDSGDRPKAPHETQRRQANPTIGEFSLTLGMGQLNIWVICFEDLHTLIYLNELAIMSLVFLKRCKLPFAYLSAMMIPFKVQWLLQQLGNMIKQVGLFSAPLCDRVVHYQWINLLDFQQPRPSCHLK